MPAARERRRPKAVDERHQRAERQHAPQGKEQQDQQREPAHQLLHREDGQIEDLPPPPCAGVVGEVPAQEPSPPFDQRPGQSHEAQLGGRVAAGEQAGPVVGGALARRVGMLLVDHAAARLGGDGEAQRDGRHQHDRQHPVRLREQEQQAGDACRADHELRDRRELDAAVGEGPLAGVRLLVVLGTFERDQGQRDRLPEEPALDPAVQAFAGHVAQVGAARLVDAAEHEGGQEHEQPGQRRRQDHRRRAGGLGEHIDETVDGPDHQRRGGAAQDAHRQQQQRGQPGMPPEQTQRERQRPAPIAGAGRELPAARDQC